MKYLLIIFVFFLFVNVSLSNNKEPNNSQPYTVIRAQSGLNANNISTWIQNTGTFNHDIRTTNTPGFEWPKGSGKTAIFSAGLTTGSYVNNNLRLAAVSYNGEYSPGYAAIGIGYTDSSKFRIYKVSRGDNGANNPDYANWILMIPYGAPYDDVNNNGVYDNLIDKPGVKNAGQTIFVCLTDGFQENHSTSEGFSGGTLPLYSEMHLTAWCYDNISQIADVQFLKMEIINKSNSNWEKTFFGIVCDPDLGESHDDYTGCDTIRNLGYCYNADNDDGGGGGTYYGVNPPAVGFDFLKSAVNRSVVPNKELNMSSFHFFQKSSQQGPLCEYEVSSSPIEAYNYLTGVKKDLTPFINPMTMQTTKFVYPGDPESGTGWTQYVGKINNCGGALTGPIQPPYAGEIRFVMSSGAENLTIVPGEKQTFVIAQMIARGNNNKNSVTKLKQLDDVVQSFYDNNYTIGVTPISTNIPDNFSLYQNYPNPFNPETKIKFEIPQSDFVNLSVYDLNGRLVEELVNEKISAGTYEVKFSSKNLSSGIYFYHLETSKFAETKKMIIIK